MAKYQIKIDQGATFQLTFWWRESLTDAAGDLIRDADEHAIPANPIDLTGYTARMQIRKAVKDATALLTLTSDPGGGITIPAPSVTLHPYAKVASTVDLALTGLQTVDGVAVQAGDRVLVKNQTAPEENGIYIASATAWSRAGDADAAAEVTTGAAVWVRSGTVQHDTVYVQQNAVAALGTDPQSWIENTQVGRIDIEITDTQTAALQTSGVYDLELEAPDGTVYRPLEGKMRLSAEVTRV